jgi:dTDP-4-dehydrorhamnose reductase
MSIPKVIIFGAGGLLGCTLVLRLRRLGYEVISVGRSSNSQFQIDITDKGALKELLEKLQPSFIVNLIAATDVDRCEINLAYAYELNVEFINNLAFAIKSYCRKPIHLVHISTDQLYDGLGPHSENLVKPINVYGLSKYAGELALSGLPVTILRTNFFGKSKSIFRQSFTDWLLVCLSKQKEFTLFDDVIFNPVHMDTLSDVIHLVISRRLNGVFNLGSHGSITKAEFGIKFAKLLKLPLDCVRISRSSDHTLKAKRPLDMSMSVSKLEGALNYRCPSIDEEILYAAKEYINV